MYDVALFFVAAVGLSAVLYVPILFRGGRRARVWGLVFVLTFSAAVPAWRVFRHKGPFMFWRLERAASPFVAHLYWYRGVHGRFPSSTAELSVQPPATAFGAFEYRPLANGQAFSLHVGKYSRDLFEMWWDLGCQCWRTDT